MRVWLSFGGGGDEVLGLGEVGCGEEIGGGGSIGVRKSEAEGGGGRRYSCVQARMMLRSWRVLEKVR